MSCEISVLIPVYGVEPYIKRCAESLLNQTFKEGVELIFINDATEDRSIGILEETVSAYPDYPGTVRIINHDVNRGLPAARNTGLDNATGKYIVHIDGDDYAGSEMLETLYNAAEENDADFVWCDYYIDFGNKKRIIRQPSFGSPEEAVCGMLRGSMKYNVWNKICRRSIYEDNGIRFPEGYAMGEDLTMIMVALHSSKCAYVGKALYNYVRNEGQMTAAYNEEKLESLRFNCDRIRNYIENRFPESGLESEYAALCQLMKWPFLLDGKKSSYRRWQNWFPESDRYIWQTRGVNFRIKLVEWCAAKGLYPLVRLHYFLIIKLFYGIVYGK